MFIAEFRVSSKIRQVVLVVISAPAVCVQDLQLVVVDYVVYCPRLFLSTFFKVALLYLVQIVV